jgi:hypothetical protein
MPARRTVVVLDSWGDLMRCKASEIEALVKAAQAIVDTVNPNRGVSTEIVALRAALARIYGLPF